MGGRAAWTIDAELGPPVAYPEEGGRFTTRDVKIGPGKVPKEIDGGGFRGIDAFDGHLVRVAYTSGDRPATFGAEPGGTATSSAGPRRRTDTESRGRVVGRVRRPGGSRPPLWRSRGSADHAHRRANGSWSSPRSANVLLAELSRTDGRGGSTGCNSGVLAGGWNGTTSGGTFGFSATCQPARSGTGANTFTPVGSARRAKSDSDAPIVSAFTFGRIVVRFRPPVGCAYPDTYGEANLCRPLEVGRCPLRAHARRATGLGPNRASSCARTSTTFSGWACRRFARRVKAAPAVGRRWRRRDARDVAPAARTPGRTTGAGRSGCDRRREHGQRELSGLAILQTPPGRVARVRRCPPRKLRRGRPRRDALGRGFEYRERRTGRRGRGVPLGAAPTASAHDHRRKGRRPGRGRPAPGRASPGDRPRREPHARPAKPYGCGDRVSRPAGAAGPGANAFATPHREAARAPGRQSRRVFGGFSGCGPAARASLLRAG